MCVFACVYVHMSDQGGEYLVLLPQPGAVSGVRHILLRRRQKQPVLLKRLPEAAWLLSTKYQLHRQQQPHAGFSGAPLWRMFLKLPPTMSVAADSNGLCRLLMITV